MDKMVEDFIINEATALAHARKIADIERVIDIMKRTAMDCRGVRFHQDRPGKNPLEDGLAFVPSLDDALVFLPPDKALTLFEDTEIEELQLKTGIARYWFDKGTPFYTHQELAGLIAMFTKYLNDNRISLLSIGYPAKSFETSHWLYSKLSRLCPVKIPNSLQGRSHVRQRAAEADNIVERDAEENLIFAYTWIKERTYPFVPLGTQTRCTYEQAPLIDGLSENDVEHIEELRGKLLNLKMQILGIGYGCLKERRDSTGFWAKCRDAICERVSAEDFNRFSEIEDAYSDLFVLYGLSNGWCVTAENPFTRFSKDLDAGGIRNLIQFIGFVEQELTIGKMHNTKARLLPLIGEQGHVSYYELVSSPKIAEIDRVILDWLDYEKEETEFVAAFNRKLCGDLGRRLKTPLLVSPERYDAIKSYAQFIETHDGIGIDVRGRFVTPVPKGREISPIKLPPDTKWEDITIRFLDGHNVNVKFKGLSLKVNFKDMGFQDDRTLKPNKQWLLLALLAQRNGELTRTYPGASPSNKKKKQLLSQTLKAYFQIDEDPFLPYKREKSYKIRIKLIPE